MKSPLSVSAIKEWYFRYERWISSLSLIGGFVFDIFALKRVDLFIENFWIVIHLLMAGGGIILLNFIENEGRKSKLDEVTQARLHFWFIIAIQFAFGGLLSTFLVFYFRSASLSSSWPFLLILLVAFASNEIFKHHYARLSFQISILFLSIYSFFIFSIPVLLHKIGDEVFLFSGLASLIVIGLFVYALWFITKERFRESRNILFLSIISIFVVVNVLYFTNIIPPIPLSLKDGGVYHSLTKDANSNYVVTEEPHTWLDALRFHDNVYIQAGQPLYVYTAIFSPTDFDIHITHIWQYYDEKSKKWITANKVDLPIVGGRDGGFRTYSQKSNLFSGKWRVNVETQSGLHIGRISFTVTLTTNVPIVNTLTLN